MADDANVWEPSATPLALDGAMALLGKQSVDGSSTATLDFLNVLDATYRSFLLRYHNVHSNGAAPAILFARLSEDGGASWESDSYIMSGTLGSAFNWVNGEIKFHGFTEVREKASLATYIHDTGLALLDPSNSTDTVVADSLQIAFDTSTILFGDFYLYGIDKV